MSKRSKQNVLYWTNRIDTLFGIRPDMKKVSKRYETLKILLQKKYPEITNNPDILDFLKDTVYLDRKCRWATEGEEELTKKILSQEFIINEL